MEKVIKKNKSSSIDQKFIWSQRRSLLFAFIFLIAIAVAAQIIKPGFLGASHLNTLINQASFLGIVAVGQMLVIMTGGIDMSISYTVTLGTVLSANIMSHNNANTFKAVLIVILAGIIVGCINAIGVHFLKIPSLIMTLGVGNVVYGFFLLYSDGAPSGYRSDILNSFVNEKALGIFSGELIIWIIVSVIMIILLNYTSIGRSVYAFGTNPEAAKYSGINVGSTTFFVYITSSVLAAVVGLLICGYTGSASIRAGDAYNMDTITAVVLGGTSIVGGKGSYVGTLIGVLIMYFLTSLLTMLYIPEYGKNILQGIIILIMILLVYRNKQE